MRFLSTRVHGIIDYLTGGLLSSRPGSSASQTVARRNGCR
jgi:hypothetical protein